MSIFNSVSLNEFVTRASEHGCIATGSPQVQIHHVLGRKAKFRKLPIGKWWILPLWWVLHDVGSDHPQNITHHKKAFEHEYGTQKDLFIRLCENIGCYPPADIYTAIIDYR
jgi:hypothetical protein